MKIFYSKKKLVKELNGDPNIEFVPTMGSLHQGHLSLIKKAKSNSNKALVSIFINPKQFEKKTDYRKYPKNIKSDIKILEKSKVDYLYIPNYEDIYAFKIKNKIHLHLFSNKLCGKFRPGHFKGVINVVNRFIEIINPKSIYLGIKDYQQLILIKEHIKKNKLKTKIIACKTIRIKNGVALSSPNKKKKKKNIIIASNVYKYLKKNEKKIKESKNSTNINKFLLDLMSFGVKKIDYLECVNLYKFLKPKIKKKKFNIFIAYYLDDVRLIDNL